MVRYCAVTWSANVLAVTAVVDEFQIDVMVLGLSTNTKAPSLDAWEDDSDELSKRGWIERDNTVGTTAFCIFRVDAIAGDGSFCKTANRFQPISLLVTIHLATSTNLPKHGKELLGLFRLGSSVVLDDFRGYVLQVPTLILV